MEILYVTIHLIIVTKVFSFDFASIIRTLPPEFSDVFKNKVLEMYSKHPEVFEDVPAKGKLLGVKQKLHKVKKPDILRVDNEIQKAPTTAKPKNVKVVLPSLLQPPTIAQLPLMPPMTINEPRKSILPIPVVNMVKPAIPQPIAIPSTVIKPEIPDPLMPMPITPLPMSFIYPQVPIIIPMRTFYEPVIHQHPAIGTIKQIIKEDEEKWVKYEEQWRKYRNDMNNRLTQEKLRHSSKETDHSDTDSEDDPYEYWNYYDDFIHVTRHS